MLAILEMENKKIFSIQLTWIQLIEFIKEHPNTKSITIVDFVDDFTRLECSCLCHKKEEQESKKDSRQDIVRLLT